MDSRLATRRVCSRADPALRASASNSRVVPTDGTAARAITDFGDRTVVIAGGVGDATSQATLQVMNRFLNRLPTITIREGHRVKVYLTSDLDLPAYVASGVPTPF